MKHVNYIKTDFNSRCAFWRGKSSLPLVNRGCSSWAKILSPTTRRQKQKKSYLPAASAELCAARARALRGGADQPLPSPSRPPARPASPPSPRSGIDSDCHHPPPPSCSRMRYIPVRDRDCHGQRSIHSSFALPQSLRPKTG